MLVKLLCLFAVVTSVLTQTPNISDAYLEGLFSELFTTPSSTDVWTRPITTSTTVRSFVTVRTTLPSLPVRGLVTTPVSPLIDDSQYGVEKICSVGVCLPYYLCNNTDGAGILDVRLGEVVNGEVLPNEDAECHYLETCCPEENTQPQPEKEQYVDIGCGYNTASDKLFKIKKVDHESQYGEFPWMVALLKEDLIAGGSLKSYLCGGALIHPQVVLTAAHCVHDRYPHEMIIRVGEWDTQTVNEPFPHQDRNVSEVIIHEAFAKGSLHNDVALLLINEGVDLAENINTVCLPPPNYVFDGSRCVASGWGKDVFGLQGKNQVILKSIELPIVPRQQCLSALRTTRLGRRFLLHNSFICAGGEAGKDTCKGDGGSPLVCPIPGTINRYYHAGIVAWGIGCGENQIPGVYGGVAMFRNWIDMKFNIKGLDTSFYTA